MRALLLMCAASVYGADVAMLVRQVVAYEYGKDPAAARELRQFIDCLLSRSATPGYLRCIAMPTGRAI
jgi:hypothetical protein